MPRNPSQYAKGMALLSSRVFGEVSPAQFKKSKPVLKFFSAEPYYKNREFTNWYPPIHASNCLTKELRKLGLYVDEHLDFTEYMEEQRELRGKGQKNRKRKEYTKKSDQ